MSSHKQPVPTQTELWDLQILKTFGKRENGLTVNWQTSHWGSIYGICYCLLNYKDQNVIEFIRFRKDGC